MKPKFLVYILLFILPRCILAQQCTFANYMGAVRIPVASYPYFMSGAGVTVSATTAGGVSTLSDFSYACGGNTFSGTSPAWWLNANTQTITLNFSAAVTNITYLINGSNAGEVFYITSNTGSASISLSNYCAPGMSSIGNTMTCGATAGLGALITVNNPIGATQYRITHNGAGSGSRVTLLDCATPLALPVELSSFNATCVSKKTASLFWETKSEKGNDYFTIERSRDAETWQAIGEVDGAGDSRASHYYSFGDEKPLTGKVYYRLKQTDFNKVSVYSNIVTVSDCSENTDDVVIYPNPASAEFIVSGNNIETLQLFNLFGREIINRKISTESDLKISVADLPQGIYFLKIAEKNYKIIKE